MKKNQGMQRRGKDVENKGRGEGKQAETAQIIMDMNKKVEKGEEVVKQWQEVEEKEYRREIGFTRKWKCKRRKESEVGMRCLLHL